MHGHTYGTLDMTTNKRGVPLTKNERANYEAEQAALRDDERKSIAEKAKAAGARKIPMTDNMGRMSEPFAFANSYKKMRFQDHQIAAAERFEVDWQAAYRVLRGQGFEKAPDGSFAPHRMHFAQVDAQTRLRACRDYLRPKQFELVTAIVINGLTITAIMKLTGKDNHAVKALVEQAFNDLDAFYHNSRKKDAMWESLERFNLERAELIERAEREVG